LSDRIEDDVKKAVESKPWDVRARRRQKTTMWS